MMFFAEHGDEVHLIVSKAAESIIDYELGDEAELPATARYSESDWDSPLASSSFCALLDAMAVVPCSMKTLAGIAKGYADNLIIRVAENILRLGKKLVIVPRETPLSLADIENMRHLKLAGAIVLPPVVAYYYKPKTIEDVTDFLVGKVLDVLGLEHDLYKRWEGK